MDKRTVKLVMIVAMLLTVSLYFISGTYARYIDTFEGTASIGVAAWKVALKNGGENLSNEFTLDLTREENTFVVEGKIAPDVTATGKLELDLTDTEVAVDVEADYDKSQITEKLAALDPGLTEEDIEVTVKTYKSSDATEKTPIGKTIALPSGAKFSGDEAKYTVEVSVTWTNSDENNTIDTNIGKKAGTAEEELKLEVPLKLTVKQHVKSDA